MTRRPHFNSSSFISPRSWITLLYALAMCCTGASRTLADAALEGTNPAQWRLVWNADPDTTATLCWNTAEAGHMHRVRLREEGSEKDTVFEANRSGRYSCESPTLFFHHVHLSDLEPATKYHVVFESDGKRSPAMYFVTAPEDDVPLSLLFGADSRSGLKERRLMNRMLSRMFTESQTADRAPILAFVHGGDFVVRGRRLDQWSQWMSDYELTAGADGRLLPIIPARGNHDDGELFNEIFAFPPGDTNYYITDIGPQVRMITLNTETSITGDQLHWLKQELPGSRAEKRWLLVQYHRPAFPAVKGPGLNRIHWVPRFEEHNVDMVCEGDGHNIKRTPPIRDSNIDPTGVVYIGEGGLGVGQRTPKKHRWYLNSPQAKVGKGHHIQLLTFDREQLAYRVVMLGGEVFDEYFRPVRTPARKPVEAALTR